jgi:flagellar basal-body rod modification protein FlgD
MSSITAMNPLVSHAASASSSPTVPSSTSSSSNQLTGNSFIQLLVAQLKAQDPTNPMDPTTFVTQLVQFNQLQQLIDINQTLSKPVSTPPVATPAGTTTPSKHSPAASQANAAVGSTGKV